MSHFKETAFSFDRDQVSVRVGGDRLVCEEVSVCTSFLARAKGLLGRAELAPSQGALIVPCTSVHTIFMKFAIDVLYFDRAGRLVKIVRDLPPWRLSWGVRTSFAVLEVASGQGSRLELGDRLVWR